MTRGANIVSLELNRGVWSLAAISQTALSVACLGAVRLIFDSFRVCGVNRDAQFSGTAFRGSVGVLCTAELLAYDACH
jgi:hypothetical protein